MVGASAQMTTVQVRIVIQWHLIIQWHQSEYDSTNTPLSIAVYLFILFHNYRDMANLCHNGLKQTGSN